jgi:hypothetical protein
MQVEMLWCQLGRNPHLISWSIVVGIGWLMISACGTNEVADQSAKTQTLVLTESVRIGDEAKGDSVFFSNIWDIEVDSRGRLFVADFAMYGFRVFTSNGSLIREIGREGEGPGEFSIAPLLYVSPQDSVYAYDLDSDRLTVYAPGGDVLAYTMELPTDEISGARPTDILASLETGLLFEYLRALPRGSESEIDGMLEIKLVDHNGQFLRDSLVLTPSMQITTVSDNGFSIPFPRQFGRRSLLALGSDGLIYHGWTDEISIRALAVDGTMANEFAVSHVSVPVTSEEKSTRAAGYPENWQEELRQDMPDTKPAFNAMVPDDQGQLWFRLSWPEGALETEWIVVEAESGNVVAKTTLSTGVGLETIRGGKAYGTLDDDDAVLVVWDIAE